MSVDFYPCDYCGRTFCACGRYVRCNNDCERRWCSDRCAKADGFRTSDGYGEETDDEECAYEKTCNFCREEDFTDHELLEFILKQIGFTREQVVMQFGDWIRSQRNNRE